MASTSARGPALDNHLKPEISAPGASVSAVAGTGTSQLSFDVSKTFLFETIVSLLKYFHPQGYGTVSKLRLKNYVSIPDNCHEF